MQNSTRTRFRYKRYTCTLLVNAEWMVALTIRRPSRLNFATQVLADEAKIRSSSDISGAF